MVEVVKYLKQRAKGKKPRKCTKPKFVAKYQWVAYWNWCGSYRKNVSTAIRLWEQHSTL
jgi:hypothetical protein